MKRYFEENTLLNEIPQSVYFELENRLDDSELWGRLIKRIPPFYKRNLDKNELAKSQERPSVILLRHLVKREVNVALLAKWLERAGLQSPLALIKDDEPLVILQVPSREVFVNDGSCLVLPCSAKSFPFPEYKWYKDGNELVHNHVGDLRNKRVHHHEGDLIVDPVRQEHSGIYVCRVSSSADSYETTESCCVKVIQPGKDVCQACCPVERVVSHKEGEYIAGQKKALLIANDVCGSLKPLPLPSKDVATLALLLMEIDFQVTALHNLKYTEMKNAMHTFCQNIGKDCYVFFYFAGHGVQLSMQTYLLPTDGPDNFNCVSPEIVLDTMFSVDYVWTCIQEYSPAINVMILDVCRKEPENAEDIVPERIVTPLKEKNTVFCYATTPFSPAHEKDGDENGILVTHLKECIQNHESIHEVFRKLQSSIEKDPFVNGCQVPVVQSTLSDPRSLTDRICGPVCNILSWTNPSTLPFRKKLFPVPDKHLTVMLEVYHHQKTICNGMDIHVTFNIAQGASLNSASKLEVILEFIGLPSIPVFLKLFCENCPPSLRNVVEFLDSQNTKIGLTATPIHLKLFCEGCSSSLCNVVEILELQNVMEDFQGLITVKDYASNSVIQSEFFEFSTHQQLHLMLSSTAALEADRNEAGMKASDCKTEINQSSLMT